jgi:hypothetical protein
LRRKEEERRKKSEQKWRSSSAIAAKIVRVMLAALKIGWTANLEANFLFMDVEAIPLGKFCQNIAGGGRQVRRTAHFVAWRTQG